MSPRLELIRERKLCELLPGLTGDDRLEASGVVVVGPYAWVSFDNIRRIARIARSLAPGPSNRLITLRGPGAGYEDITYDSRRRRFYVVIEAEKEARGEYRASVAEYDHRWRFRRLTGLSTVFGNANKGFEGLCHLMRGGREYLLAMCEGNLCTAAKQGGGRIQAFRRTARGGWSWSHELALPASAEFEDYAGIALRSGRVALVSQASRRLWIGRLDRAARGFVDDGMTCKFPDKRYCNVEGVAWLSEDQLVVVSDRRKGRQQRKRCATHDQSIHVFRIPDES